MVTFLFQSESKVRKTMVFSRRFPNNNQFPVELISSSDVSYDQVAWSTLLSLQDVWLFLVAIEYAQP